MDINLWAVLVSAIVSMIIGGIWYGPMFGKKWMQILGMKEEDCANTPGMWKLYLTQFILSIVQVYGLAWVLVSVVVGSAFGAAVMLWLAFIVPILAGSVLWTNTSRNIALQQFLIQAGYQLIFMIVAAYILSVWR